MIRKVSKKKAKAKREQRKVYAGNATAYMKIQLSGIC